MSACSCSVRDSRGGAAGRYRRAPGSRVEPASTLIVLVLLAVTSCRDEEPPRRFSVYSGTVQSVQVDAGELTVRVPAAAAGDAGADELSCVVTRDSELYVNDRFAGLVEIAPGDEVELIGHADPNPRLERFVVSFAYVNHPLPPAPVPRWTTESAPTAGEPEQQEP